MDTMTFSTLTIGAVAFKVSRFFKLPLSAKAIKFSLDSVYILSTLCVCDLVKVQTSYFRPILLEIAFWYMAADVRVETGIALKCCSL